MEQKFNLFYSQRKPKNYLVEVEYILFEKTENLKKIGPCSFSSVDYRYLRISVKLFSLEFKSDISYL